MTATLRNASDTYVAEAAPSKSYGKTRRLYLADASAANTRYGFLYWGLPSGLVGSNVISAKVQIRSGNGFTGSVTLTLQRLAAKFSANRVNWTNKPGVTGSTVTVNKTSAADGTVWEFDVTALIQQVADGAAWYGFRLSGTNSTSKFVYSAQARDDYRPLLIVDYTDAPQPPDNLRPDFGHATSLAKPTLRWNFTDVAGDTTQQSFQLRLFSSQALAIANGTGDVLDTTIASTLPQVDLDDTAYGGLAADATVWWRVRVTDGAGLVSGWSEYASFKRTSKGTLTITNPAVDPNDFVNESTPPLTWTFSGRTQESYEVILTTPETPELQIWTSGKITGTTLSVTPPEGKLSVVGKTYRLIIRVWDTIDREDVPDDKTYVEASRDFTLEYSGSVAAVTGFSGTIDAVRPQIQLDWTSTTAPDEFVLIRDGVVVKSLVPIEVFVSGTAYRYTDKDATPRTAHTWSIARKVNNVMSTSNPTANGTVKSITTLLSEVDGTREVFLLNPDVAAERAESSEVQYLLGSAPPVLISQSIRGYEGSVSGVLANDVISGLTAAQMKANLDWFKQRPGVVLRLVWVDQAMQIVIRNITYEPLPLPNGGVEYLASFDFFQVA